MLNVIHSRLSDLFKNARLMNLSRILIHYDCKKSVTFKRIELRSANDTPVMISRKEIIGN